MAPPAAARPPDSSGLIARLGDVSQWDLEVIDATAVTPSMRRIRLTAPGLDALSHLPGQDLMLSVPAPPDAWFRRRYTIRFFDAGTPSIDIDMVMHGDGPAAAWAASVQPGDRIEAIGPRGKVTVNVAAAWHLFAGDDSAIPASLAMAESLPDVDQAIVLLEVDGPDDEQHGSTIDGIQLPVQWVHRSGGDPASGEPLLSALGGVPLPAGTGHAYLAGELVVVAQMRSVLLERGFESEQISAKPYWRAGRANAAHGEPERE